MKIAIGSDMACNLSQVVTDHIRNQGHEVSLFVRLVRRHRDYVDAARAVAEAVATGKSEQGLIFCYTGTGVTIIANKVRGVRAALCVDSFAASIAGASLTTPMSSFSAFASPANPWPRRSSIPG